MINKFDCFYIDNKCQYAWIVTKITIAFRIVFSFLRAFAYKYIKVDTYNATFSEKVRIRFKQQNSCFMRFLKILWGFSKTEPSPDLWHNTIIGTIELAVFPVFMRLEEYAMIGAWIGFKTVAQWDSWKTDRLIFQRYTIANAMLLIVCWYWLFPHVRIS